MKKLAIYGASSFAKQMRFYFDSDSDYQVTHFVVDADYYQYANFDGLPVIKFEELTDSLSPTTHAMFVAIGYQNMTARLPMFSRASESGFELVNFVSTKAIVAYDAVYGVNNVFMPGVIVEPFSLIANNNIFWSGSTLCHDARVGSHNFFAAGSIVGGNCSVADACFLGFNSVIREKLKLGDNTTVGACSYLNREVPGGNAYVGMPVHKADKNIEL